MTKAPMPLNWPENSASSTMSTAFPEEEYWDALPKVQYHLDQPLADPSCIALYFVSKLAAEHVKVVLSGEGRTSCSAATVFITSLPPWRDTKGCPLRRAAAPGRALPV